MTQPQILDSRTWHQISPAHAGWRYISFGVVQLGRGGRLELPADGNERALIPLRGRAEAEAGTASWQFGGRASVFAGLGWCLYLPRDIPATVTARSDLELAIAASPARQRLQPVLVTPDDLAIEVRGAGTATRQVSTLMPPDFPADRLHVVEVWTPGGNWSSYPPHKHDQDRPGEAQLEETYYYRLRDPQRGWALQRVYSEERGFELCQPVRDGDLLLIPWGYHTTVAAHGHDLYYLNVLAGPAPQRTLRASDDPCLACVRDDWPRMDTDPRVPFVPRYPGP